MSGDREGELVRIQVVRGRFPSTWQGWIASVLAGAFAVAIIALVAILASAVLVFALIALLVAIALAVLRLMFSPADIARGYREFRRNRNA